MSNETVHSCAAFIDEVMEARIAELDSQIYLVLRTVFQFQGSYDVAIFATRGPDEEAQIEALLDITEQDELPAEKPPAVNDDLWSLLNEIEDDNSHILTMARIDVICAMSLLQTCQNFCAVGNVSSAILCYGKAHMMIGRAHGRGISTFAKGSLNHTMRLNAKLRLEVDPKQAAKLQVKECWDLWQAEPARYKNQTKFAKDMLEKFEVLASEEVIRRWSRDWKKLKTQPA